MCEAGTVRLNTMLRRKHFWLFIFACCWSVHSVFGQSYLQFFHEPILSEAERSSMMYSFVDRNLPLIPVPSTRAEWEQSKPKIRAEILKRLGLENLDQRGPVKWISKGFIDHDGYTIEKIIYQSYPGIWVPALVYTPKHLSARAPAMVSIPGHVYCEGKSSESNQARSVNLVRRGLIVISYDYIDTFERNTGANPCALMPYGGGNDHGLAAFSYTKPGGPTGLEVLDGIRAIDYLYTRNDVDRSRIGFTGESGGGNSTYWVAAIDPRVRLAVPVVAVTSYDYWIVNDRDWDWHQRPFGIRRIADVWTLIALAGPHPFLAISSLRGTDSDEMPIEQAEIAVSRAKKVYDLYGKGDDVQLWQSTTSHGYQLDKRERMYRWVEKYFLGHDVSAEKESAFPMEPQTDLACGLPSDNKTWRDVYNEWLAQAARRLETLRAEDFTATAQTQLRARLVDLLALPERTYHSTVTNLMVTSRGDAVIRRMVIETAPGIRLPAVQLDSRDLKPGYTVIFLGKSDEFTPAIAPLLAVGARVIMVDLRGTGEINSGGDRTTNWAWFMGRPWQGLWTEDVESVVAAISREYPGSPIALVGVGQLGKVALFAAALDKNIGASYIQLADTSYRDEAQRGGVADLPGVLGIVDIPQIVAIVAPRPCWISTEEHLSDQELRSRLAWSVKAYQSSHVAVQSLRIEHRNAEDWGSVAAWFAAKLPENQ
jgi:hypothetical protein